MNPFRTHRTDTAQNALRSRALRFAAFVATCVFVVLAVPACGGALAVLPDVIAYILDGMQVLDVVAAFVDRYFVQHPNPVAQARVADALAKARNALNVALRSAQGAEKMDNAQVDAAFDDFKKAYLDLISLVRSFGMNVTTTPTGNMKATLSASGEEALEVPEPLVFKKAVKR